MANKSHKQHCPCAISDNPIVSYAFHMPITANERREFNAIAELVRRDEYLPIGYRKPKAPAPIVENIQNYVTRS